MRRPRLPVLLLVAWTDGSVGPARHRPELVAVPRRSGGRSDLVHPRRRPVPRDVGFPASARV